MHCLGLKSVVLVLILCLGALTPGITAFGCGHTRNCIKPGNKGLRLGAPLKGPPHSTVLSFLSFSSLPSTSPRVKPFNEAQLPKACRLLAPQVHSSSCRDTATRSNSSGSNCLSSSNSRGRVVRQRISPLAASSPEHAGHGFEGGPLRAPQGALQEQLAVAAEAAKPGAGSIAARLRPAAAAVRRIATEGPQTLLWFLRRGCPSRSGAPRKQQSVSLTR